MVALTQVLLRDLTFLDGSGSFISDGKIDIRQVTYVYCHLRDPPPLYVYTLSPSVTFHSESFETNTQVIFHVSK